MVEGDNFDEKYKFIRNTMMVRGKMHGLNVTFKDHQEFLKYMRETKDKKYGATKKT